ncbi:MAG: DNA repair protein RadA [Leptospirales bacterium]|nr:DNA repair protein RadA [Leptospirales bacterium]
MARKKSISSFVCRNCGESHSRWAGKCAACGSWNSLEENEAQFASAPRSGQNRQLQLATLDALHMQPSAARLCTGLAEFDRILGGGLPPGAFVLLAGEPGAGKSTLLLELIRKFQHTAIYFTGEESAQQIALRAARLGIETSALRIAHETELDLIAACIETERPALALIDSIQTLSLGAREGAPGAAAALRSAALRLMEAAKISTTAIVASGHVTKDGAIAGPRLLEHMVDASLFFESDRSNHYRILRALKNRFGAVGESAFFEMGQRGLRPLERLGELSTVSGGPGRVHSALLEGSRALAVEVQALVTRCYYGPARRTADGLDSRRLSLLAAVLEKTLRVRLAECDIFANLAGGLDSNDPALDLALCAAVLSSQAEIAVPPGFACFGEVGLSGEVRSGPRSRDRIGELVRQGFVRIALPDGELIDPLPEGVDLHRIGQIADLAALLGAAPH